MKKTRRLIVTAGLCAVASFGGAAHGMWMMPEHVPVERLVTNLTARTKENPLDANNFFSLGRAHSLAFTLKTRQVAAFNGDPAPAWMQEFGRGDKKGDAPTAEQLRTHLIEGVRALSRAVELEPMRAEFCLSLASLLEAGKEYAGEIDVLPGVSDPAAVPMVHTHDHALAHLDEPEEAQSVRLALGLDVQRWELNDARRNMAVTVYALRNDKDAAQQARVRKLLREDWLEQTTDLYFRAFAINLDKESKIAEQPMRGVRSMVGYEAAENYARVIKARGPREQDKVRLATVEAACSAWDKVPESHIITPIVLSLEGAEGLDELLDPALRTKFDLDGTGSGQTWGWVKPTTGILVWDPSHAGKITSGRQLFGSVSWWMLFDNGYSALSALDDNRDGELSGDELNGIAVWFDRDSNGVSDAGEVVPIEKTPIASLSTKTTSIDGESPANLAGMKMKDGRVLGTWDWVTRPVQAHARGVSPVWAIAAGVMATMFGGVHVSVRRRKP